MSGSKFDSANAVFSPEGKLFQVQYAQNAVDSSETIIGIKCKDGILLGGEKQITSKLLVAKTNRRIYNINEEIGGIISGMLPDGRSIVDRARYETSEYQKQFSIPISGTILAERIGQFSHVFTQYTSYRPLGSSIILASYNAEEGYNLHMIEPSGHCYAYHACTSGKGKQVAKAEFEKRDFKQLTCQEALPYLTKILNLTHEEFKDKKYEYELSWICAESNNKHVLVPDNLREQAEKKALDMIEEDEMAD